MFGPAIGININMRCIEIFDTIDGMNLEQD